MIIYGSDLAYKNSELQIAANGEVLLVHKADTVIQDIFIRLNMRLGSLFYDRTYGSYLMDYVKDENTEDNRFSLCDEVVRRVEADPRVVPGSPEAEVDAWDHDSLTVSLSFKLTDSDNTYNLVLALDKKTEDMELFT